MNLTSSELSQSCLAILACLLLFVPAGFLLGSSLDLWRFRSRSATEQLLWSCSLAIPFGLGIASVLGRWLPRGAPLLLLISIDLASFALLWARWRHGKRPHIKLDRLTRYVLLALIAALIYIPLAGIPLRFHGRLYEPVCSTDWEIRLPLVQAALRYGIPPHNPFFTFGGQSPPMRYYYFWYGLCAQVARLAHTDARSTLIASSVLALFGLTSTLFLYLKYLLPSPVSLRLRCAVALALCCVLGLDVLPSTLGLFLWRKRLVPEIEWWSSDRSPGLPGAILFAPHHIAGVVCGLLGFLLLGSLTLSRTRVTTRQVLTHGLLGALCFAALVGTSTFMVFFFALAVSLLFLDCCRRRDLRAVSAMLLTGAVSLAISWPFLRELTAKTVVSQGNGKGKHALKLLLRDNVQAQRFLYLLLTRVHLHYSHGIARFANRTVMIAALYVCEFGFFLFVLVRQVRKDLLRPGPLPQHKRLMWFLAASVGFFFFFVSSSPIQDINDLGLHAGLLLRLLLVLWGANLVSLYLARRRQLPPRTRHSWTVRLAAACLVLGVCATVWQAVIDRTYLVLLEKHIVPAAVPFPNVMHPAKIYNDIYEAQAATARLLPTEAVTQINPMSRYGIIFRLYQQRRQAAGDVSCEGSFGGDPTLCQSYVPLLLTLYGTHLNTPKGKIWPKPDPAAMTPEAFTSLCNQVGITAMLASRADPVWYFPGSWVWHEPLLYANQTVRVLACPAQQAQGSLPAPAGSHLADSSAAGMRLPVE